MNRTPRTVVVLVALFSVTCPEALQAYDFTLGRSIDGNLRAELSYGLRIRTEHPDPALVNLSLGDHNFEKGDLTNNKVSSRLEIEARTPEHFMVFFRDEIFYDFVYDDKEKFSGEAMRHAAYNFTDALEGYLEGKFGEFTFRVGRQIIMWGESISAVFAPSVNVVSPFSVQKVQSAGYTSRDWQVPLLMVWLNYFHKGTLSIEALYQPEYDPRYVLPVVGTFSSSRDVGFGEPDIMSSGGRDIVLDHQYPRDFVEQYGFSVRKTFPSLNYFELGLYYFHHLDRLPSLTTDFHVTSPSTLTVTYEEMDMFGASFSHAIQSFDLNLELGGDLAFRPNDTLQKNFILDSPFLAHMRGVNVGDSIGPVGGFNRGKTLNWAVNGMKMFSDVMPFTPWTVSLRAVFELYGGINLEYEEEIPYTDPARTYYYMTNFTAQSTDMIDNTMMTFDTKVYGNLHYQQHNLHHFVFSLRGKYGDAWEVLLGYDYIIGNAEEDNGPNNMYDRDAFTFQFIYYFM